MSENGRRRLADFLTTQPVTADVDPAKVMTATRRDELGISSLNMILVLVGYINERADGKLNVRPEWVSQLGEIDGIVSVLDKIDSEARASAGAG